MRILSKSFFLMMFLVLLVPAKAQIPNIIGQVYWPNGDEVQGVLLQVSFMRGNCHEPSGTVWTNPDGTFDLIGDWPAGLYWVRVTIWINGVRYDSCWQSVNFDGRFQALPDVSLMVLDPWVACMEPCIGIDSPD